jgi:hypothetical protein
MAFYFDISEPARKKLEQQVKKKEEKRQSLNRLRVPSARIPTAPLPFDPSQMGPALPPTPSPTGIPLATPSVSAAPRQSMAERIQQFEAPRPPAVGSPFQGREPSLPFNQRPAKDPIGSIFQAINNGRVVIAEAVAQGIPYSLDEVFNLEAAGLTLPPGGPSGAYPKQPTDILPLIQGKAGFKETGESLLKSYREKPFAAQLATDLYNPLEYLPIPGLPGGVRRFNFPASSLLSDAPPAVKESIRLAIKKEFGPRLAQQTKMVAPDLNEIQVNDVVDNLIDAIHEPGMNESKFIEKSKSIINRVTKLGYRMKSETQEVGENVLSLFRPGIAKAGPASDEFAHLTAGAADDAGDLARQVPVEQAVAPSPVAERLAFLKEVERQGIEGAKIRVSPGNPGYRPPPRPTAAQLADDVEDAKAALTDAQTELADAKKMEVEADELVTYSNNVRDARSELRKAKQPFDTAEWERLTAAADEFDEAYAISAKKIREEITELEATLAAQQQRIAESRAGQQAFGNIGGAADDAGDLARQVPSDIPHARVVSAPTVGTHRVYHGSSRPFSNFDSGALSGESLYGPGAYTTDSPQVASGYARTTGKRRPQTNYSGQPIDHTGRVLSPDELQASPNVQSLDVTTKKFFDIDAPPDIEIVRNLKSTPDSLANGEDWANMGIDDATTNHDIYQILHGMFGNKSEVNDWLAENGYDAITHIGGKRTGTDPHRVWIALTDANNEISNVTPAFGRRVPVEQAAAPSPAAATQAASDITPSLSGAADSPLSTSPVASAADAPPPTVRPSPPPSALAIPPAPPAPPGSNLGKFDDMWAEGRKKPPRNIAAMYRTFQEYSNDFYWGMRKMQREVSNRITITPGGEKDLITYLTRAPGAGNAGATRYMLAMKEMETLAPGTLVSDIDTIIAANHGMEVMVAKGPRRVFAKFTTPEQLTDSLASLRARMGDEAYQKAEQAAGVVKRIYNEERERLVVTGFLSPEDSAIMAEKYPWYNPIRYAEYAEDQASQTGQECQTVLRCAFRDI